jgi:hypothetical protein
MSRTRLTALVALALVVLSAAVFFTRRATGGVDAGPPGTSTWEVAVTVRGEFPARGTAKGADKAAKAEPRLTIHTPPDFRRQHISDESWKSKELTRPEGRAGAKAPKERVVWKARPGAATEKGYRLTYTFRVVLGSHNPSPAMGGRSKQLDGAPKGATDPTLKATPRVQSDRRELRELAEQLGGDDPLAQFRAFHEHAVALPFQDGTGQTALDCLRNGGGDDVGKSRLLVALCRSRGIPARVIGGMVLTPNAPPKLHRWAEAWVATPDRPEPHWVPACPTYGHFGTRAWPANYLVMRVGDGPVVGGPGAPRVSLFARALPDRPAGESRVQAFWRAVSLASLPPAEQHLARFIVMLPVATVVVSVFRVVVGIQTFGVFGPALLGLVFRDLRNLAWGLGIFAATVLVGWLFRKLLDRFHLLLIPRAAVLLTMIVVFLLVVLALGARYGVQVSGYLSLFPLIILTHMVERFWTVEAEDGSWSSFKTLLGTLGVAVVVAAALSPDAVGRTVFRFPETLGVVVAVLLLLGRYTGYRLTELYRFQDVIEPAPADLSKDVRVKPAEEVAGGEGPNANPSGNPEPVGATAPAPAPADGGKQ